jgi:hypothetical protein
MLPNKSQPLGRDGEAATVIANRLTDETRLERHFVPAQPKQPSRWNFFHVSFSKEEVL